MKINVIKRDGRLKEFDYGRISDAIDKAYLEVYGHKCGIDLEDDITDEIIALAEDNGAISVEEIQDIVVGVLMEEDNKVGEAYESYRRERESNRSINSDLYKSILGLVDQTNIDVMTENANKQSQLASTQRDLIAGEVSKYIALNYMIPKHIRNAIDKGWIKMHDLDYFLQPITNCELVNLKDMLDNGTVINKKTIRKPKSLKTAVTLATQIAVQVSSSTYGGQTMSLSHLAPYVRISKEKYIKKYQDKNNIMGNKLTDEDIKFLAMCDLKDEIKDSVQTFNYQLSTMNSTNGQSPFLSLCMYINEDPEYAEETAMLIEEFLNQRIEGMENEFGIKATQTFPKLLYFLDENNIHKDSKYYYLTKLAIKATAKRMNPDYISVKRMKEDIGFAFPCMGCRSFLSPWKNEKGEYQFYGRGNLGVTTLNIPDIALSSKGDINEFWKIFDERLEIAKESLMLRYTKLKGVKASVAPIMWCHGAIARLNPDDEIISVVEKGRFTLSLGYSGVYEAVKYMTGESQTSEKGFEFAKQIMDKLNSTCQQWKEETGLGFGLYGSPQESTSGWFIDKLRKRFGIVEDITDKGWITNSYHIDIREEIDAFAKLSIEGELQKYSTGGNVSYVETYNMEKNLDALEQVIDHMYEHNIYAEINSESDSCGVCHYTGTMIADKDLNWVCPQCGNKDQSKLSVIRRTCGYLGETTWCTSRKLDILNRVKHL